ncbi:MAG: isoprenylcysteine carboxylmethyltransferase family protein [Bacteroidota bacterium]|jgi:protein-S-isoprenylcysteine O-methyltransferase Ste14
MNIKTKFALNAFIASFVSSIIVFAAAGRMNYIQGWLFMAAGIVTTAMNVFTIRENADLMKERAKPGEGTKQWDKSILGVSFIVYIGIIIAGGLDSGRYQASPPFHWGAAAAGIFLMIGGQLIFLAARNENNFFSTVVRIQKERGHTVCETGLYRVIRHPGYLGMMISTLGIPFVLGSLWCAIPSGISIFLLCARTILEDNTLKEELAGYKEYSVKTRYKLIPHGW